MAAAALCLLGIPLSIWAVYMIYLGVRDYTPDCSIDDFYVPALNTQFPLFNSTYAPTFIFFDLNLQNNLKKDGVGFRYFNSTLTVHYGLGISLPVGNCTVPRFHQGDEDVTHLHDVVETVGVPWADAGSKAVFTVVFSTRVKVKRGVGRNFVKDLLLRAHVEVNASGVKSGKKNIRLKSFSTLQSDDARGDSSEKSEFPVSSFEIVQVSDKNMVTQ